MDNFFKNQLYKWTYEKIKSNTKKFGGDFSNSLIMYEYLKEFYNDFAVYELEPQLMSILSTVSRIKNKLLEKDQFFPLNLKHILQKIRIGLQEVHLLGCLLKKLKIVFCVVENFQRINL